MKKNNDILFFQPTSGLCPCCGLPVTATSKRYPDSDCQDCGKEVFQVIGAGWNCPQHDRGGPLPEGYIGGQRKND